MGNKNDNQNKIISATAYKVAGPTLLPIRQSAKLVALESAQQDSFTRKGRNRIALACQRGFGAKHPLVLSVAGFCKCALQASIP